MTATKITLEIESAQDGPPIAVLREINDSFTDGYRNIDRRPGPTRNQLAIMRRDGTRAARRNGVRFVDYTSQKQARYL